MTFFSPTPSYPLRGQGDESRPDSNDDQTGSNVFIGPESPGRAALYPKCALCHGLIQNIIVQALGQTWHPEHFRCTHCHIPISTQKFHVHKGSPYCVEDYATLFLKKCQGCKLPIKDVVVTALNQTWHADHFVCVSCGRKLLYKGFYEKEDNAFCTDCYEGKFCPKCTECGDPITETAIKVHSKRWHEACFKCSQCGHPISGPTFRVCGEDVVCVNCGRGELGRNHYGREKEGRSPSEERKTDNVTYFEGSDDD